MRWLLPLGLPPVLLLASGFLYQTLATWHDRRTLPFAVAGGRFVRLPDGRRVYLCDTGTSRPGSPSVVFESGMIVSTLNWHLVQHALARTTRTFSYDRPSLGWSDAATAPRTPRVLAAELHDLLAAAGVPPPYVFVAHSYGALPVRAFASAYPGEVAAAVLLDPMRVEAWLPGNPATKALLSGGIRLMARAPIPIRLGVGRIAASSLLRPTRFTGFLYDIFVGAKGKSHAARMTRELAKMAPQVQPAVVAQWSLPGFYSGCAAYVRDVPASVFEMERIAPISAIPTITVRAESSPATSPAYAHCKGPQATERILPNVGHWIHLDQPGVVLDIIKDLLAGLKIRQPADASEAKDWRGMTSPAGAAPSRLHPLFPFYLRGSSIKPRPESPRAYNGTHGLR